MVLWRRRRRTKQRKLQIPGTTKTTGEVAGRPARWFRVWGSGFRTCSRMLSQCNVVPTAVRPLFLGYLGYSRWSLY